MVNNRAARSPPTSKKGSQAFVDAVGFWRMHISHYNQIISPLYQVTQEKNDLKWGPEQQQAFEQIKLEVVHPVALGPVWWQDLKYVLFMAAGENGLPETSVQVYLERLEADLWVLELGVQRI